MRYGLGLMSGLVSCKHRERVLSYMTPNIPVMPVEAVVPQNDRHTCWVKLAGSSVEGLHWACWLKLGDISQVTACSDHWLIPAPLPLFPYSLRNSAFSDQWAVTYASLCTSVISAGLVVHINYISWDCHKVPCGYRTSSFQPMGANSYQWLPR